MNDNFDINRIISLILEYGIPLIKAILIYIIGSYLIKRMLRIAAKIMTVRGYELTLQKFLLNIIKWAAIVFLIITVVGTLGVATTGLAAALASVGLAIGLALQGSLSNFAGGVLILIFKHFKVGDTIEAQDIIGTVKEIDILNTKVLTAQNKLAIIPNGPLANGNIINYSVEGILRVDTTIGVDYDTDLDLAKAVLLEMVTSHELVLKEPAPQVVVAENADSSINIHVRPYTLSNDHWTVYWYVQEHFSKVLGKAGIDIPYPHQTEVTKKQKQI